MSLLDGLEKIINEHGSSVILKERIALANDKHSMNEAKVRELEEKVKILETENQSLRLNLDQTEKETQTLRLDLGQANKEVRELEKQLSKSHSMNPDGYVCDHCGSGSLKRTGSRPDPTFKDFGIKQKLFICSECGKESAFTPDL